MNAGCGIIEGINVIYDDSNHLDCDNCVFVATESMPGGVLDGSYCSAGGICGDIEEELGIDNIVFTKDNRP